METMLGRDYQVLMMEAGYVFMGMRRFQEAKEVFEGLTFFAPDSDVPLVALGGVSFCLGKFPEAIAFYQKALKKDPASLYARAYMAEAQFFSGKKEAAIEGLEGVSKKDPKGPVGNFARALLDAIKQGFSPDVLSGVKEIREFYEKRRGQNRG